MSLNDWTPILNLFIKLLDNSLSLTLDKSSGFASRVISGFEDILNFEKIELIILFISIVSKKDGVPPPK